MRMKKLGLLGGISWPSTMDYYREINEEINRRLGGLEYAECVIYSLNFGDIQRRGWDDWEETYRLLAGGCRHLKAAGAEALVLCANTAHALADRIEAEFRLPVIHIGTATAAEIARQGLQTVGLLGTKFTMELPFYADKLREQGIGSFVPAAPATRAYIQRTLKEELGRGIATPETKAAYLAIIAELIAQGAEGIVFGCTELPLLLGPQDVPVPVFDTTKIHVRAAVEFALSGASG